MAQSSTGGVAAAKGFRNETDWVEWAPEASEYNGGRAALRNSAAEERDLSAEWMPNAVLAREASRKLKK